MRYGDYETRFDDEETFLWEVVETVSGLLLGSFATEQEAIEHITKNYQPIPREVRETCPQCGDRTRIVPSTGVCEACSDAAYDRYCPR